MRIHYPIVTERLALVAFTAADGDALYALESDPMVKQFTGGTLTRAETEQLLHHFITQVDQTGLGALAIKQRVDNQIVGLCGLIQDEQGGELFFGLARRAWGQGLATEACRGLISAGFQQRKLARISALVDPANVRSIHVLDRLDMRLLPQETAAAAHPTEWRYELDAGAWIVPA